MKQAKLVLLLATALAALWFPIRVAAQPDYIRLHIIANSDSLHDQAVKLCIRDDVRSYTSTLLGDCGSSEEAWECLAVHRDELLRVVRESALRYGFDRALSVDLGTYSFPDRTYGEETVPAGLYRAVRITLGEGAGRNWWCVVYPSLCLPEQADVDRPVEFYSSILRWATRLWEVIVS